MEAYVLAVDQSTQGTKALLFNDIGEIIAREDLPHEQIINEKGWVEHNPNEIYENTLKIVKKLIEDSGIETDKIKALGISNQRETALAWNKETGEPVYNAIVWQCARAAEICNNLKDYSSLIKNNTGLNLSSYFSAAKIAWILQNVEEATDLMQDGLLCAGTIDSWLVYKLTKGKVFKTDFSNASRTQLLNLSELTWDKKICGLFGINSNCLAEITDSDGDFGFTDFDGLLPKAIPIKAVMGDSHGALFGQGCHEKGMIKATYGTGSSIMVNVGEKISFSDSLASSVAYSFDGQVNYVLEGNINYTGAVITWLKDDLHLIESPEETEELAKSANENDTTYLIPAFSGLSAPYWESKAKAMIWGMTRTTGRAEIVKAALESIAYQITDVIEEIKNSSGIEIKELRVDGGPTRNSYLMQFQSDISKIPVSRPKYEELSAIGVAYMAGITTGIYQKDEIFAKEIRTVFQSTMKAELQECKYENWKNVVRLVISASQNIN